MKLKSTLNALATATLCLAFLSFAASCGPDKRGQDDATASADATVETVDTATAKNVQTLFYSLPSPIETASLLKESGVKYKKDYLNPVENADKYSTENNKALNLGVYGTDLSFASIFDKTQESISYMKTANSLATQLGINAFAEATVKRAESNMKNRDSLLSIITDAFLAADNYLKENDRKSISALIITGGWIEGLYIATRVAKESGNEKLMQRVSEQKLSLESLIKLLKGYETDANVSNILADINEIKTLFDGITTTSTKKVVSTDEKTNIAVIGGENKINITKEQLAAISDKVEAVRKKITSI